MMTRVLGTFLYLVSLLLGVGVYLAALKLSPKFDSPSMRLVVASVGLLLAALAWGGLSWWVGNYCHWMRHGPFRVQIDGQPRRVTLSRCARYAEVHIVDPSDRLSWIELDLTHSDHFSKVSISAGKPYVSVYSTDVSSVALGEVAEATLPTAAGKRCRVRVVVAGFSVGPDKARQLPLPKVFRSFDVRVSAEAAPDAPPLKAETPGSTQTHAHPQDREDHQLVVGGQPIEIGLHNLGGEDYRWVNIKVQDPTSRFAWGTLAVSTLNHMSVVRVWGIDFRVEAADASSDGYPEATDTLRLADGTDIEVIVTPTSYEVGPDLSPGDPYPKVFHSVTLAVRARAIERVPGIDHSAAPTDTAAKEYDVFVAHASEDKEAVVRPLVDALTSRGIRAWYDEFELRVGDKPMQVIDEGLKRSERGIVVLSPSFFSKDWSQLELSAMVSTMQASRPILPIWHNITAGDIGKYSPILSGILAAKTADGLESVIDQLCRSIR